MPYDMDFNEHSRLIFLAERRRVKRMRILWIGAAFVCVVLVASLPVILS